MQSWKTTVGGVVGILIGLGMLGNVLNQFFKGESVTFEEVSIALTAIGAGITGLTARDNNVSSQDVGIR